MADLRRDYDILKEARREAMELIKENPELNGLEELKKLMKFRFGEKFDLVEVG